MKKYIILLMSLILSVTWVSDSWAAELNKNEKKVIESLSEDDFPVEIEQQYINQLKNYFCQNEVSLENEEAENFIEYLKLAAEKEKKADDNGKSFSDAFLMNQNVQKALNEIGLYVQYDSLANGVYAIDGAGHIVLDCQPIIKNTGKNDFVKKYDIFHNTQNDLSEDRGIEPTIIIAIVLLAAAVLLCVFCNEEVRKKISKIKKGSAKSREKRHHKKNRRKKENIKQYLKYVYVPIIMSVVLLNICVVGIKVVHVEEKMGYNAFDEHSVNMNNTQNDSIKEISDSKQKDNIKLKDVAWPKYGEQYGKLICEKLKIDAPVFWGDRGSILYEGAGSYCGTSIPGDGSSILIGAHDTTYFEGLEKAEAGDEFKFLTTYGTFKYQVSKTEIYDSEDYDKAYSAKSDKEQLILYTCYPFGRLKGTKTERMFVYLDKKSGPSIEY